MPTRRINEEERRRCVKACGPCRRRKERCDGHHPCSRCVKRKVEAECSFLTQPYKSTSLTGFQTATPLSNSALVSPPHTQDSVSAPIAHTPEDPQFVHHHKGDYIFLGDSATVSFFQDLRRLVRTCLGDCDFTCNPIPSILLGHPPLAPTPSNDGATVIPKPSFEEATKLIRNAIWAADFLAEVLDEAELVQNLPAWLASSPLARHPLDDIYHLVMAIGLQITYTNQNRLADQYFHRGHTSVVTSLDDPNVAMVQCSILIIWYLLGSTRRSAAYMFLSLAIQAAYALGLHRTDVGMLFPPAQTRARQGLWRCIHVLDGFMATSLGRPVLTTKSIVDDLNETYSARAGLNKIFTVIQIEIYEKRKISMEVLERVSQMHRDWAQRLDEGLVTDQIHPDVEVSTPDGLLPNMALIHLKLSYYYSIILITRHTLMEHARPSNRELSESSNPLSKMAILVDACVHSAIQMVQLSQVFLRARMKPARMPLVVNAIFVSALVLGAAYLADCCDRFPVAAHLDATHELLELIGKHDPLAEEMRKIVRHLQSAIRAFIESRATKNHNKTAQKVAELFGDCSAKSAEDQQATSSTNHSQQSDEPLHDRYHGDLQLDAGINGTLPSSTDEFGGFIQGDPNLAWLNDMETLHFGSYSEISAFFNIAG